MCVVSDLVSDGLLFSEWYSASSTHPEARLSGVSGTTLSQGSGGSGNSVELVLGEASPSSSVVLLKVVPWLRGSQVPMSRISP